MSRQIYALRFAHRPPSPGIGFYRGHPHDGEYALEFFVWVVVTDGEAVVIDSGFTPETAAARPTDDRVLADITELLGQVGVRARDVKTVALTHLDWDHAGGTELFPAATFVVQDREVAFWTGRHAARQGQRFRVQVEDVVRIVRLNYDRRLAFVDGDREIAPGIGVHFVGGHAAGMQVVRVDTAEGPVVLASDASNFYANLEQDRPFSIVHCVPEMHDAFDRIRDLAAGGIVVPGHDSEVLERHPAVSGALEGLAVRLEPR